MNGIYEYLDTLIPTQYHKAVDLVLAGVLMSGPLGLLDYVQQINHWLALGGGVIGLFIGLFRVYEIANEIRTKREQKED